MTAAQRERIAADFVVAFINSGRIKTPKESAKAFQKINEALTPVKAPPTRTRATKTATTKKTAATKKKAEGR